jgi:hypothetical protein
MALLFISAYAGTSSHSANGCRYDNSLGILCNDSLKVEKNDVCLLLNICLLPGLLTKKFIYLLKVAEDGNLDLNKAAEILEVLFSIQQNNNASHCL